MRRLLLLVPLLLGLSLVHVDRQVAALERDYTANLPYEDSGENLLHRIKPVVSYRMPLASVTEALLLNHVSAGARRAAVVACRFIQLALMLALAEFLEVPLAGLAAVAAYTASGSGEFDNHVSVLFFYTPLICLVGLALIRRAKERTPSSAWRVGAMIGASLSFRSVLAFLPPLVAMVDTLAWRRPGRALKDAPALLLLPYLFLAPWLWMNAAIYRQVIPFEYKEADPIVVAGALGRVEALDRAELAVPGQDRTGSVLLWAAGETARHPVRYAVGYARRAWFALSQAPALYALAAVGLALNAGDAGFGALGLLAGYFFAIHCAMGVVGAYFVPLFPFLFVLACSPLDRIFKRAAGGASPGAASVFADVCAFAALAGAAATLSLAGRFALEKDFFAERRWATALDHALAARPDEAWLRSQRGLLRMESGELAGALEDFTRAQAIQPSERAAARLAWARAVAADPQQSALLEGRRALRHGDEDLALRSIAAVSAAASPEALHDFALEADRLGRHRAALAALTRLVRAQPRSGRYLKDLAVAEYHAGDESSAVRRLQQAIALEPRLLASYVSLAYIEQRRGRRAEALKTCERALAAGPPEDPELAPVAARLRADLQAAAR